MQFDWNKVVLSQQYRTALAGGVKDISKVKGSPYINEEYKRGYIYYNDSLNNAVYLRHNGYTDEIEVKPSYSSDQMGSLLKDSRISAKIGNDIVSFIPSFQDTDGTITDGYLYLLRDGEKYDLFLRKKVVYKEGVKAVTSFEANFPDSFEPKEAYYLATAEATPTELKLNAKTWYQLAGDEHKADVKNFIKKNKLDPTEGSDAIQILTFLESL